MTYLFMLRDSRKTHTSYSEHTFNMQKAVERLIKILINGNHLRPGPTFFIGFTTPDGPGRGWTGAMNCVA